MLARGTTKSEGQDCCFLRPSGGGRGARRGPHSVASGFFVENGVGWGWGVLYETLRLFSSAHTFLPCLPGPVLWRQPCSWHAVKPFLCLFCHLFILVVVVGGRAEWENPQTPHWARSPQDSILGPMRSPPKPKPRVPRSTDWDAQAPPNLSSAFMLLLIGLGDGGENPAFESL